MYNNYIQNGVVLSPNVLAEGDTATVLYRGILRNSGADNVYIHLGYGERWNDSRDIQMSRTSEGFEARIPVSYRDKLNLAFKDSASNWDNNSGSNYSFEVQSR